MTSGRVWVELLESNITCSWTSPQLKYDRPRDSDRLYYLINDWRCKLGRKATLDLAKFLNGCKKVNKRKSCGIKISGTAAKDNTTG